MFYNMVEENRYQIGNLYEFQGEIQRITDELNFKYIVFVLDTTMVYIFVYAHVN